MYERLLLTRIIYFFSVCLLDASTSKVVLSMGRSGHTSKVTSMTFASNDVVNWTMEGKDLIVSKLYIFNSDKVTEIFFYPSSGWLS